MSNAAGLVIIALGVVIAIIGIRGTQKTILPQLFSSTAAISTNATTSSNTTSTSNANNSNGTIV